MPKIIKYQLRNKNVFSSIYFEASKKCGSSSVGRASAFQAECRGSESRLPLI